MLRAIASDIRCLGRRDGFIKTVRRVGGGLRGHDVVVIAKSLDEIADIAFEERMELADLGVADLPALAEFNARRCDRRATGRGAVAAPR